MRAVIVDDEELARGFLREMLAAHPEIEIVAECANGFEAVKAIAETAPDLVFLDVQMPKLDGFEVLELIEPRQAPAVIFVTAYDQYAMRAFDAHAVDYLLKPFSAERFERALERAKARLGERKPAAELAREARAPGERPQRLAVRDGTRVHVIPLEKLDYAEAQDDYVALHSGGKSYLKQQTIGSLEGLLDPARFVRIHRSAIVNLERVARIEPYAQGEPGGDSHRRHAAAGEPLGLRAAAGSHGRFAGQPQHHAVDAAARAGLEGRVLSVAHLEPAADVGEAHSQVVRRGRFGIEGVFHGDGNRCAGAARGEPDGTAFHQAGDAVLDGVLDQRLQQQGGNRAVFAGRLDFLLHAETRAEAHLLHLQVAAGQRQLLAKRNALAAAQSPGCRAGSRRGARTFPGRARRRGWPERRWNEGC